jgi:chemotaxis protein CheX
VRVEYINPFLESAIAVFQTMLGVSLVRGEPFLKKTGQPNHEVSGIIGLSGKAQGTVVLSMSRSAALSTASALLGQPLTEIAADTADAIGELTNIISGQAKAQLEHLALNVSLPSVITGRTHCIEFPKKVTPICIPFTCDWGELAVEVGLSETA